MTHSALVNDIINKKINDEFDSETIRRIETGLEFNVLESKGKSEKKLFCIQLNLFRITFVSSKDQIVGAVNLRDLREVRLGGLIKLLDTKCEEIRHKCFTLYYGKKFRLKEISAFANTTQDLNILINSVNYLQPKLLRAPYHSLIDIMLRREFAELNKITTFWERLSNHSVVLKDMKTFLSKIHCKLTNQQLKQRFHEVDRAFAHQLDFEGFSTFYMNLLYFESNKFFSQHIGSYTSDGKRVTLKEFIDFLKYEQKVDFPNEKEVSNLIKDYLLDPLRHYEIDPYFTITEFIDYLYSKDNSVWDSKYESVYQDMNQPLSHYFIATSHNTYLSGDQFKSESSVECYARSLRMGCRCIELDCWDGPEGKPLIYHGRTLTSKIRFIDVITTIKEQAFTKSDYPLILSIENHCSLKQQQYMAEAFVRVFGDLLLTKQIDSKEQSMPSPNQLKHKIILKHKKLTRPFEDKTINSPKPEEHETDLDISDSIKNGELFIEDPIEKKWKSHYFVLTREKLYYIEPNNEEEEEEDEDDNLYGTRDSLQYYQDNAYELHYGETWFHGKIRGGRAEAELLLQRYLCGNNCNCLRSSDSILRCSDGTFLVRESETNIGDYSLSFIYQNQYNHSRIIVKMGKNGHKTYSLNDFVSFNSLYELITHYQTHPLRSQKFRQLYLTTPIPQPNSHEDKVWFHKNMTRSEAEDMLRRLRNDGAFLVRPSERSSSHDENLFAISFRAENKIKHCRIRREGRLFVIGSAEFESLTELIDYYEKNPLYRKVKLKFPATEENVRILGGEPDLNSQCNYTNPKTVSIKVKACYDYRGNTDEELTFSAGDIITNVIKQDHGWWKGDFGRKTGCYFPSNFVEEIEEEEIKPFDSNKFSLDLKHGSIELDSDNLVLIPNVPNRSREWVFRLGTQEISAKSEEDLKEWINKIQETIQMNKLKVKSIKEVKQNLKIAPELDDLIVYCSAVPYNGHTTHFTEMSSFHEIKMEKLINPINFRNILRYNEKQLSRVYPKGSRLDSSNYDPIRMWNCGVQMVALNYQTPDKSMQLNEAMFLQNGKCGYALKPNYMFDDNYNPYEKPLETHNFEPLTLTVRVIGARHLKKSLKGIVSPSIEIEIIGVEYDCKKCLTRVVNDNGLNPIWSKETFVFNIMCPDLALIRFLVSHLDTFDDSSFVGQSTLPVSCLRRGYRSIQLKNEYSEELELSTLLINIDIRKAQENNIKTSVEMLKNNEKKLHKMIAESKNNGNLEEVKRLETVLEKVETALKTKTEENRFVTLGFNDKNEMKIISELSINKKFQKAKITLD